MKHKVVLALLTLAAHSLSAAASLSDAPNYRDYDTMLTSAGQPSAAQLEDARDLGFARVIYLAYTDNHSAIEDEDRIVTDLGMDYVHIPVHFEQPTLANFKAFVGVMGDENTRKTLVHCQVNFRASTFAFLYRVIVQKVPMLDAKNDLDSVWAPNEDWFRFIRTVLADYELSPACAGCDWGAHEFIGD